MQFPSLVFLFIFFPIVIVLYNLNRSSLYRKIILLAASLLFYAWGEPFFVILLVLMILFTWQAAIWIEKAEKNNSSGSIALTTIAIVASLLPLVFLKITTTSGLDLPIMPGFQKEISNLSLPLGISFFTFSTISYLVDVKRGEISADNNLLHVANYMAFFPKLLQGPITRFEVIQPVLDHPKTNPDEMAEGLRRFIIGLAKKVLIADNLAVVADKVFNLNIQYISAGLAWYGLAAFAIQIYMDFSGYSDMAIGLGHMFGFNLPENFNFPYLSRSIADFWRRWHMSLMNFFRNYIFFPLEIARRKEKYFRQQSNLLIIFLVTGLWHGITENFILWGLYFGLISVLESSFLEKWLKKLPVWLQHLYSLALISIGWVFFRIENISSWGSFFKAMLGLNQPSILYTSRTLNILMYFPLLILGMIACTTLFNNLYKRSRENRTASIAVDVVLLGLLVLCISVTVSGSYQAFLYSEF
jgi:alginate O-acetyltransferase complex protein AlgI